MSVYSKIQQVMKKVSRLEKDGAVGSGNYGYKYLSEELVTGSIHDACADAGLVMFPSKMEILETYTVEKPQKSDMHFARIRVEYTLTDVDDDKSFITVQSLGEGSDTGDKVLNKAMTAAFKYAQRETFLISTGDDPDKEMSEPVDLPAQPKPSEKPAPKPQPKPAETIKPVDGTLTKPELAQIHTLASKRGLSGAGYKVWLKAVYGTAKDAELKSHQLPEIVDALGVLAPEDCGAYNEKATEAQG